MLKTGYFIFIIPCIVIFCTPDDGRVYRPKHVEWTCREINLTAHCCICWSFHRELKTEICYTFVFLLNT